MFLSASAAMNIINAKITTLATPTTPIHTGVFDEVGGGAAHAGGGGGGGSGGLECVVDAEGLECTTGMAGASGAMLTAAAAAVAVFC